MNIANIQKNLEATKQLAIELEAANPAEPLASVLRARVDSALQIVEALGRSGEKTPAAAKPAGK